MSTWPRFGRVKVASTVRGHGKQRPGETRFRVVESCSTAEVKLRMKRVRGRFDSCYQRGSCHLHCHARREFFATFSQFQVHLNVTQVKQIINLSLLNHFYPVISYRRVQKKEEGYQRKELRRVSRT